MTDVVDWRVLILLSGFFLALVVAGCGEQFESCESLNHSACDDAEVCVEEQCRPITTIDLELEFIDGAGAGEDQYKAGVLERGDTLLFVSTSSPPTTTPEWREKTVLEISHNTDWWQFYMEGENTERFGCQFEANKEQIVDAMGEDGVVCEDSSLRPGDYYFRLGVEPVP